MVLAGNHQQRLQTDMDHLQRNTSVRTCIPYIIYCDYHNTKLAGWLFIYILLLPSRKVRQLIIIITIAVYTYTYGVQLFYNIKGEKYSIRITCTVRDTEMLLVYIIILLRLHVFAIEDTLNYIIIYRFLKIL